MNNFEPAIMVNGIVTGIRPTGISVVAMSLLNNQKNSKKLVFVTSEGTLWECNSISLLAYLKRRIEVTPKKSKGFISKVRSFEKFHFKRILMFMQIAYDYKAVPSTVAEESLGFAANGAYLNEKGWSGVVQFFKPKGLPSTDVCSYRQSNLQLTGGAANLAKELVTYIVNNKPTIIEAAGNQASGYSYTVEWYDDNFRHVLECADKMYLKSTSDAVIELAKQIDSTVS